MLLTMLCSTQVYVDDTNNNYEPLVMDDLSSPDPGATQRPQQTVDVCAHDNPAYIAGPEQCQSTPVERMNQGSRVYSSAGHRLEMVESPRDGPSEYYSRQLLYEQPTSSLYRDIRARRSELQRVSLVTPDPTSCA